MFNPNMVSVFGEKTYEETGEAVLSHTLILHPLYMERKIIPKKDKRSVAFFTLWGSERKKLKGLCEVHRIPKMYVTSKHTSTATHGTFYTNR
jgi:hypothetical protein